ncbi:MAG: glycine zipper domain-containing protein [Candidatus Woesearchaeota archaeon]
MANKKKEELRKQLYDRVDALIDETEDITERGKNIAENIHEKIHETKKNIYDARERTDKYIQEKPEQSVLIAAGVGAAIGAIITATIMRRRN